jgi:hypothetical protein
METSITVLRQVVEDIVTYEPIVSQGFLKISSLLTDDAERPQGLPGLRGADRPWPSTPASHPAAWTDDNSGKSVDPGVPPDDRPGQRHWPRVLTAA